MLINQIGLINKETNHFSVNIEKSYIKALKGLEGYSHLQIVWWANECDSDQIRNVLNLKHLFKKGPEEMGVFATRSPVRPNPIMISIIEIEKIDFEKGIIYTPFIDANHHTPVLDIKPYNLMERVKNCQVPNWCEHWPKWFEDTSNFNWKEEINREED